MRLMLWMLLALVGLGCKSEGDEYRVPAEYKQQIIATKNTVSAARSVALRFLQDQKRCPTLSEIATRSRMTDAWGNGLVLICPSGFSDGRIDIASNGKDGVPNTADDIRSWEIDRQ